MSKKAPKQLLPIIKSNCEYLTNLVHISQTSPISQYKKMPSHPTCPISIAKIIVQLTYLYYSCTMYQADLWVTGQPLFVRKIGLGLSEAVLVYWLAGEDDDGVSGHFGEFRDYCGFTLLKSSQFNPSIVTFIEHILTQTLQPTPQKPPQHPPSIPKLLLSNFSKTLSKQIQPLLLQNSEYQVIKHLQRTKLFQNYSDILQIFKTSIFYRLKKDQKIVEFMRNSKGTFMSKVMYLNQVKNWLMVYKALDRFLLQLTSYQIILLEKSSTKDSGGLNSFAVGAMLKYIENGKQRQKYQAKFYTIFSNLPQHPKQQKPQKPSQQQQKQQKNIYTLTFSIDNLQMQVKYITKLQASSQKIDAISFHCSNISFMNARISVEPIDFLHTSLGTVQTKKYIAFKVAYRMERIQEPFTVGLMLIQYVTICTKIFLELVVKKPHKDPTAALLQYTRRLDHFLRIFIEKAQNFYRNL